jgi:hypothetical protein
MKSLCGFYGTHFLKRDAPYCYDPVLCINLQRIKAKKEAQREKEEAERFVPCLSIDVDLSVIQRSPSRSSPRGLTDSNASPRQADKHSRLQRIMTKRAEGNPIPTELSTCPPLSVSSSANDAKGTSSLNFYTNPRTNRAPVQRSFTLATTPSSAQPSRLSEESEQEHDAGSRLGKKIEKSHTIGSKSPPSLINKSSKGILEGIQLRNNAKLNADRPSQESEKSRERVESPERNARTEPRAREKEPVVSDVPRTARSPERRNRGEIERERERERRTRRPSVSSPPVMSEDRLEAHWLQKEERFGQEERERIRGDARTLEEADEEPTSVLASSKLTNATNQLCDELSPGQSGRSDNRSTGTRMRRERAEARGEKFGEKFEKKEEKEEHTAQSLSPSRVRFQISEEKKRDANEESDRIVPSEKEKVASLFALPSSPRDASSAVRASSPRARIPVQRNFTIGSAANNKSPNNSNSFEITIKSNEKGNENQNYAELHNNHDNNNVENIATPSILEFAEATPNLLDVHASIEQLEHYLEMQRTFKVEARSDETSKPETSPNECTNESNLHSNAGASDTEATLSDEMLGQVLTQMNRTLTSAKKGTVRMEAISPRRNMYRAEVDQSSLDKKFEKIVSFQTQIKSPRTLRMEREQLGNQQQQQPNGVDVNVDSSVSHSNESEFATSRRPNPWYDQLFASSEVAMKIPENVDVMTYLDEYYEKHLKSKESSENQDNFL